ncbi:hypothetical protein ACRE_035910 [Hapsidospora chrysogenum ATCC 11550]|uniref:Uncharacterized protein n=1 Tax=Hapsidospora chrysogenum (strain ATCC 11550 / CBS 779.69 / DSM 880 / IAM 14645 / JCM 23072 / IMI 49137) TaxID=857340 RepID=A0A086T860_HAPC1|nr:hypothetical protein ACRE_035910 [Hapsidospora chrysogenum ATCC 11550]
MPFFGSTRHAEPVPEPEPEPAPRKGLFHRREPEPEPAVHPDAAPAKKHGLFHRRSSSPSPPPAGRHSTSSASSAGVGHAHGHSTLQKGGRAGSILSRFSRDGDVDPSIVAAREQVMGAEAAEVEADRALDAARQRVREAKEHVRRLEAEAAEDARRARIKQVQAREVSKRGQGLGRHG